MSEEQHDSPVEQEQSPDTPAAEPFDYTDDELDQLAILLQEFLSAETFYQKQCLIEGNSILLSAAADAALAGLLLEYDEQPEIKPSIEIHYHLVRRSREIEIRNAFAEMRETVQQMSTGAPDAETLALVDVIGDFITTEDYESKRRQLDEHPELLSQGVDVAFQSLIRTHTARGETNTVRQLIIHRDLLRACRELGVEAAFERMENPPEVLDIITENTIAVLTHRASERKTWVESVNQSRIRAAELEDEPMLVLLRAIGRLLAGESVDQISPSLDGEHLEAWLAIAAAARQQADSATLN